MKDSKLVELFKKLYYNEAIRYLFIGGCTTLVNIVAFAILTRCFTFDASLSILGVCVFNARILANVLSIFLAIVFAYITNKIFVFQSKTHGVRAVFYEFLRFFGGRLSTMVIEVGGLELAVRVFGQSEMVAKLETQILVIIGNYFISKFLVFRKPKEEEDSAREMTKD